LVLAVGESPCLHRVSPEGRSTHWKRRGKLMNLSARNQLKGTVIEAKKGQTTAHVRINIGSATVTASITNEAVDELKLAKGMTVYAVIKASDVMVGVD
jgi:molybdopterin-binding protein